MSNEKKRKCSHFSEASHRRLCLEFEEGIVQLLVVDVNLTHLGLYTFSCLSLERHVGLLLFDCVAHRRDAGVGDGCRELERCFLYSSLALQIVSLRAPVLRNRDGVPNVQLVSLSSM